MSSMPARYATRSRPELSANPDDYLCGWAPCWDPVLAEYVITIARPCGHDTWDVPACPDHTMQIRAQAGATADTRCLTCREANRYQVIRVRNR